jgi:hypothetical protein
MATPSGISRRIPQCINRLEFKDPEGALVNLFPAIDKTAKKRRPKAGVGERIKEFLHDEEVLITAVGCNNVLHGVQVDGMSLPEALYKFGRTSIMHEGELDPRLRFNDAGILEIGREGWNLPVGFIVGMALAVIIAKENLGERTPDGIGINIFGRQFLLNEIWGNPDAVRNHICAVFHDPALFSPHH